ncbi:MAG: DUF1428 family protein [Pseudohongiella sp.]|nr:DUF1428 family protein [Pseudohongiella sp.]
MSNSRSSSGVSGHRSWICDRFVTSSSYHGKEAKLDSKEYGSFTGAAGAGNGETVVISYIEWPDKETRDKGMERVTSDPRMQFQDRPPAFDGKRLIAAGFNPMLDE